MSQPAPAPAPAAGAQQPAAAAPVVIPAPRPGGRTVVDTPALLNRWQLVGVSIAIVFGIVSALLQFLAWQSDGSAADDTEQLIRVQEIQSTLLRADALATNSFLRGGPGDEDQLGDYDEAMTDVFRLITAAAEAQPADQAALERLSNDANDYAEAVALAQANNRQGYEVGSEYLSGASDRLRTNALPVLESLVEANQTRAEDAMGGQHPIWIALVGLVALVGLWFVNRLLAQHFRRRINVGVGVAAVIVLVVTVIASVAAWRGDSQNDGLLDKELRTAIDNAEARTAANDAKANESLRLIKRGSGATYEDPWTDAAGVVEERASEGLLEGWNAYVVRHEEIVTLDEKDLWKPARRIATIDTDEGSTAPFDTFDEKVAGLVEDNGDKTTDALRSGRDFALAGSLITLVLGFVAAVAVARGIGARRKEYA